ncbi:hypothetical protein DNTS_030268 [Danionella cerebrum]|uniref:Membrane insertase YidC/Oxa/ALB C-terminal domain-containing protein n=1 Tax=Danionella cerebrum TaxID=2873325 RepID=A0A553NW75_9TELE|nr:hypothetical protein DNTS_030268 [Danionella translucida]
MDKVNDAKSDGNLFEHSKAELKRKNFLKKHSISQYKGFLSAGVQAPIFFSFFFGLRSMAELPVPSLQTGGLWWFTDLTACDPYHILPVLVSFSMFCVIKMGAEFDLDPKLIALKKIFMCLPIVLFPFFKAFPMAVNFYWLTSNSFALVQTGVLQLPAIRKRLRIPTRLVHSPSEGSDESVFAVMKKDWQRIKLANQLDVRERKIKARLDLAAKGSSHSSSQSKLEEDEDRPKRSPEEPKHSCLLERKLKISPKMKLKEDMSPLLLQVFRSVVWVYSVITFLPWYLLSGASGNQARAKRLKSRSVSTASITYETEHF